MENSSKKTMHNLKITSIGEILFDIYPGEKNLGGAPFNFIYHINKISGGGNFISSVGNDYLGSNIRSFFTANNIEDKFLQTVENRPTGKAVANLDGKKIPHWKIEEETAYDYILSRNEIEELINDGTDCLYFGTLAQRSEVSRSTIQSLFGNQIKYFCDLNIRQNYYSKDIIEKSLAAANVLKLNYDELNLINNLLLKEKFEIVSLAKYISSKYGIDLICITLGEDGAVLFKDENTDRYKVHVDNIVDTVGAGDAYAAVLCLGYLNDWDISKINKLACFFAAEITRIDGALPKDDAVYEKIRNEFKDGWKRENK